MTILQTCGNISVTILKTVTETVVASDSPRESGTGESPMPIAVMNITPESHPELSVGGDVSPGVMWAHIDRYVE